MSNAADMHFVNSSGEAIGVALRHFASGAPSDRLAAHFLIQERSR
jgi:hypothetical protein